MLRGICNVLKSESASFCDVKNTRFSSPYGTHVSLPPMVKTTSFKNIPILNGLANLLSQVFSTYKILYLKNKKYTESNF